MQSELYFLEFSTFQNKSPSIYIVQESAVLLRSSRNVL